MAKARVSTNPLYKGGAGGYTFYVRGGEQIVRQRRNNSNYGDTASRTRAQMLRRIMWGNLVNLFKNIKAWQPSAYDSKSQGQTDYNIFMSLNINRSPIAMLKGQNLMGGCVLDSYDVSRGSLASITSTCDTSTMHFITDIKISEAITSGTTVGALAQDIINNNPQFVAGDNVAMVIFNQWEEPRIEVPRVSSRYAEITLNPSNTALLSTLPVLGTRLSKSTGGYLQVSYTATGPYMPDNEFAFVAIHTRRGSGQLQVSSQQIVLSSDEIVQEYTGEEWYNTCIQSFGVDEDVPLDPSFSSAPISRVTANDEPIQNADVLSGSQIVRVYGRSGRPTNYKLVCGGVDYIPLGYGDDYDEYIITSAASVVIYVNGYVYMSFSVGQISIPSPLTGRVDAWLSRAGGGLDQSTHVSSLNGCANLPYEVTEGYPCVTIHLYWEGESAPSQSSFELVNCTVDVWYAPVDGAYVTVRLYPVDDNEPFYASYDGLICIVSNYSA